MAEQIGVRDETPTVSRLIVVPVVSETTDTIVNVPVPLAILTKCVVFMPPGVNYSVGVGVGFNGKKFIPTDDPDDFIYGSGFPHEYLAGWQVQNGVDVFLHQNNVFPHRIYVALYLDRRPTQSAPKSTLIVPR